MVAGTCSHLTRSERERRNPPPPTRAVCSVPRLRSHKVIDVSPFTERGAFRCPGGNFNVNISCSCFQSLDAVAVTLYRRLPAAAVVLYIFTCI